MRIYKITSPNTELVYVGKTRQSLEKRLSGHRTAYNAWLDGKLQDQCACYNVLECGIGDATIELLEETDDATREGFWIKELGACNIYKLDHDHAAYKAEWFQANKAKLLQKSKERYQVKREEDLRTMKAYQAANREHIRGRQSEKLTCSICGKSSARSNLARHQRSKSCLEAKR